LATDSDYLPNWQTVTASVVFQAALANGDVLKVTDLWSPKTMVLTTPIVALIDTDGTLKLRKTPDPGGTGDYAPVKLLGNPSSLNLDGPLFYNFTISGIKLSGGSLWPPRSPALSKRPMSTAATIDLIDYIRQPSQIAAGVNFIAPGAVRTVDGNKLQFSFGGVDIPTAVSINVNSSAIEDATDRHKPF
jgi:hypothetical protein